MPRYKGRYGVVDIRGVARFRRALGEQFPKTLMADIAKLARAQILPRLRKAVPKRSGRSRGALYVRHTKASNAVEFGYRRRAHYFGATPYKSKVRDEISRHLPGVIALAFRSAHRVLPKLGDTAR